MEASLFSKTERNTDNEELSYLQFEGQTNIGLCRVSCRVHLNL